MYLLKKKNINNVIIESSSHGLDQKRLHHINFKGGIFTNFSQDHLDYHKTMKNYLNAKLILFRKILKKKLQLYLIKKLNHFYLLKKFPKRKNLRLIDISKELEKIKSIAKSPQANLKLQI